MPRTNTASSDQEKDSHDVKDGPHGDDHVELMEWQSPWPFLSAADGKLCLHIQALILH